MAFFPMFFDLEGKKILAVGAGAVGSRRIATLVSFGARVTVVSKEATDTVQRLAREGSIRWLALDYRDYRMEPSFFMVLTATGDRRIDEMAAKDARSAGAFVNVAGDKTQSDFYFPGIAKEGVVTAGIIADGTDHGLAKKMTKRVRELFARSLIETEKDTKKQGADGDGQ